MLIATSGAITTTGWPVGSIPFVGYGRAERRK